MKIPTIKIPIIKIQTIKIVTINITTIIIPTIPTIQPQPLFSRKITAEVSAALNPVILAIWSIWSVTKAKSFVGQQLRCQSAAIILAEHYER